MIVGQANEGVIGEGGKERKTTQKLRNFLRLFI